MNIDALVESLCELGLSGRDGWRIRKALEQLAEVDESKLGQTARFIEPEFRTAVNALRMLREDLEK